MDQKRKKSEVAPNYQFPTLTYLAAGNTNLASHTLTKIFIVSMAGKEGDQRPCTTLFTGFTFWAK